ncbi:MAG: hypothetical protein AAF911_09300 [Planctomycetota bacterium]
MKRIFFGMGVFAVLSLSTTASADLIVVQDFDGGGPEWAFTLDPVAGTFGSSSDVFEPVSSLPSTSVGSGNFLGARDIENGDNPNGDFATASFATVDVSDLTDVEISFDYDVVGYDTGDSVEYEVFIDGVGSGSTALVTGGVGGISGSGTETIDIDDSAETISIVLTITQNGASDYAGFDNFEVNGIPEPASLALVTLGGLAMLDRGRRQA